MPEEFKKQVQYFNKVLTLFIVILVVMSVIIASLIILKLQEIRTVDNLDKIIKGTLEEYKPDREKTQQSRDTIQENNGLLKQLVNQSVFFPSTTTK